MRDLYILSQQEAMQIEPWPHRAILSIETLDIPAKLKPGWEHRLTLSFEDITTQMEGYRIFDEKHARQICFAMDRWLSDSKITQLFVHCFAGLSRSVAVGRWLLDTYPDEFKLKTPKDFTLANHRVYRVLTQVGLEDMYARG